MDGIARLKLDSVAARRELPGWVGTLGPWIAWLREQATEVELDELAYEDYASADAASRARAVWSRFLDKAEYFDWGEPGGEDTGWSQLHFFLSVPDSPTPFQRCFASTLMLIGICLPGRLGINWVSNDIEPAAWILREILVLERPPLKPLLGFLVWIYEHLHNEQEDTRWYSESDDNMDGTLEPNFDEFLFVLFVLLVAAAVSNPADPRLADLQTLGDAHYKDKLAFIDPFDIEYGNEPRPRLYTPGEVVSDFRGRELGVAESLLAGLEEDSDRIHLAWLLELIGDDPTEERGKAALTELFNEVQQLVRLGGVKRVVTAIDEIVRVVRFPDWQQTAAGEREVRKALRKTLFDYNRSFGPDLLSDKELFEKVYGCIQQYY